jgi:hypothetical protein
MPVIQVWTSLPAEAGLATIHTTIRIATITPIVFESNVSSPPDPRLSARGHGRMPTDAGNRANPIADGTDPILPTLTGKISRL